MLLTEDVVHNTTQNHIHKFVNNNKQPQALKLVKAYDLLVLACLAVRLGALVQCISLSCQSQTSL